MLSPVAYLNLYHHFAEKEGKTLMLVLRRKTSESIILNGVIKITVLGVEGDRVKIGIDAPPDVIVVREELLDNDYQASHQGPRSPNQPQSEAGTPPSSDHD